MARRDSYGPSPQPYPPPSPPTMGYSTTIVLLTILISIPPVWCLTKYNDAEHVTAILGESVVLNCSISLPKTPYIIQWKKESDLKIKIPIYIWYEGYDPHVEDSYKGRASTVTTESTYDLASLELTDIREADQGWYECKVFFLDRRSHTDNATWVHLDVHAPTRFTKVPDPISATTHKDITTTPLALPLGPKPAPPRKVKVKANKDGTVLISWLPPKDLQVPVAYYDIEYKNEGSWKKLNSKQILDSTSFTTKKLNPGKKYTFRVFAKTLTSFQVSIEVEFTVPMQDKDKAIAAALIGGFISFTVAIILCVKK